MDRKVLEQTLVDFMERRFHVLVCTSIIENGIDLPNVNTIIIDNAHLMGLSQLYQLRGRVGRSHQQGYCSFLIPEKITKEAMNRIATLQRYTELGSGFSIAAADLELRGSGNLLGREQSGHIQSVGLDTYLDILSQVVNELSQKPTISIDADIDLPKTGRIPEDYITHPDERLQFHRILATAEYIHETRQLLDKWEIEYGPVPQEARQLVWYTESRIWCAQLGIRILHWLKKRVHLQFDTRVCLDEPRISMIARRYPERMSVKIDGQNVDVYVRFETAEAEHPFHFLLWIFQTFKPNSDLG
jgi:transcription-repair coupling factor (superfamily II helicase)